ncbi:MAG: ketopantoate reductase family protein [Myxococcota bacterium]|nr:ketopantoate reductase family protein [Myxococcota bacterium]
MTEATRSGSTVIIGAGAVGLALGSCLHTAGERIHYVVRPRSGPHPIEAHGIERRGLFGEARVPPGSAEVSFSLAEVPGLAVDTILVCTKSTSNAEVSRAIAANWPRFARRPEVVVCQNGWGNAEAFAQVTEPEKVASASILTGFRRIQDHAVEITVHAKAIQVGSLYTRDVEPLGRLCGAISAGGIPCETNPNIEAELVAKLLYNCLLNPLGALTRAPYGRLGEGESTRGVMEAVAREIFAVLAESDLRTHWRGADHYLETFYRDLLPPTAGHESSMLQDLEANRGTEIDTLCGAVVELGERCGVPTPVNAALRELIHAAERRT